MQFIYATKSLVKIAKTKAIIILTTVKNHKSLPASISPRWGASPGARPARNSGFYTHCTLFSFNLSYNYLHVRPSLQPYISQL